MDGVIESGLLSYLGPYGLSVVCLICVYFLWQRQNDQFREFGEKVSSTMDRLTTKIDAASEKADRAAADSESCRTEHRASTATMTAQNAEFQLRMAETRPTREEIETQMNRIIQGIQDAVKPLSEDMALVKNRLLNGR